MPAGTMGHGSYGSRVVFGMPALLRRSKQLTPDTCSRQPHRLPRYRSPRWYLYPRLDEFLAYCVERFLTRMPDLERPLKTTQSNSIIRHVKIWRPREDKGTCSRSPGWEGAELGPKARPHVACFPLECPSPSAQSMPPGSGMPLQSLPIGVGGGGSLRITIFHSWGRGRNLVTQSC